MATFIRLAKLTDQGVRRIKDFGRVIGEAKEIMEKEGVKILHAYATMGTYDFIAVIDAPNQEAMLKASALIAAKGNFTAETLAALSVKEFSELVEGE